MKTQLVILVGAASLVACRPHSNNNSDLGEPDETPTTTETGGEDDGPDEDDPPVPPDAGGGAGDGDGDPGDGDGDPGDGDGDDQRARCDIASFERVTPTWLHTAEGDGDAIPTVHRLRTAPDGQLVAAGALDSRRGPVDSVAFIHRWKLDAEAYERTDLVMAKGRVLALEADAEHVYALFDSEIRRWRLDGDDAEDDRWAYEGKGLRDLEVAGDRVAAVETRMGRFVQDGYALGYAITKDLPPIVSDSWEFGQDLAKGVAASDIIASPWGGWIVAGAESFDAKNRRLWLASVPNRDQAVTMAFAEPANILELVRDGEALLAVTHQRGRPVLWVSHIAGDQGGHELWRRTLEVCGQAEAEGEFYEVVERGDSLWALGSVYAGPALGVADGNAPVLVEFDRAGDLLSTRVIDVGDATAKFLTLAPLDDGLAIGGRLDDEDGKHLRVVARVSL